MPTKRPEYRNGRDHCDFVQKLSTYCDSAATFESLIRDQLGAHYAVETVDVAERGRVEEALLAGQARADVIRTVVETPPRS